MIKKSYSWIFACAIFSSLIIFQLLYPAVSFLDNRASNNSSMEYKILATSKTSTLEKELNQAAEEGYRFEGVSGGQTAVGGDEVVAIMSRDRQGDGKPNYSYKLLATNKTSKMQKELQAAGEAGFEYRGQTISQTAFGGKEVILILERNRNSVSPKFEYQLLATSKTSTMQKELKGASGSGFIFAGVTVAETAFGGNEVVVILQKRVSD